jgi:Glycosyl hydrolases family 25
VKVGVDISHWQETVDFNAASSALDFVFLKATESVGFVDATFRPRWLALGALGFPRGAYHFAHPASPVGPQVQHFVNTVEQAGWRDGDVAILDLEGVAAAGTLSSLVRGGLAYGPFSSPRQDVFWERANAFSAPSPGALLTWAAGWVAGVQAQLGTVPVLYTFPSFWRDTMRNPDLRDVGAIGWMARYASSVWAPPWTRLTGWPEEPIWQCSNGVSGCVTDVPGIGKVDYDKMPDKTFNTLFVRGLGLASGAAPSFQTQDEIQALTREGRGQDWNEVN